MEGRFDGQQSSNLEIYKDAFAPPPLQRSKPWERAPVSSHAPRFQGRRVWKKSGLQSARPTRGSDQENEELAELELGKGGVGARKKARVGAGRENIRDALWLEEHVEEGIEVVDGNNVLSPLKKGIDLGEDSALVIPRKRTNANHLITPRRGKRAPLEELTAVGSTKKEQVNDISVLTTGLSPQKSPRKPQLNGLGDIAQSTLQSPKKVLINDIDTLPTSPSSQTLSQNVPLNDLEDSQTRSPEKPTRRRKSMRKSSRRLTLQEHTALLPDEERRVSLESSMDFTPVFGGNSERVAIDMEPVINNDLGDAADHSSAIVEPLPSYSEVGPDLEESHKEREAATNVMSSETVKTASESPLKIPLNDLEEPENVPTTSQPSPQKSPQRKKSLRQSTRRTAYGNIEPEAVPDTVEEDTPAQLSAPLGVLATEVALEGAQSDFQPDKEVEAPSASINITLQDPVVETEQHSPLHTSEMFTTEKDAEPSAELPDIQATVEEFDEETAELQQSSPLPIVPSEDEVVPSNSMVIDNGESSEPQTLDPQSIILETVETTTVPLSSSPMKSSSTPSSRKRSSSQRRGTRRSTRTTRASSVQPELQAFPANTPSKIPVPVGLRDTNEAEEQGSVPAGDQADDLNHSLAVEEASFQVELIEDDQQSAVIFEAEAQQIASQLSLEDVPEETSMPNFEALEQPAVLESAVDDTEQAAIDTEPRPCLEETGQEEKMDQETSHTASPERDGIQLKDVQLEDVQPELNVIASPIEESSGENTLTETITETITDQTKELEVLEPTYEGDSLSSVNENPTISPISFSPILEAQAEPISESASIEEFGTLEPISLSVATENILENTAEDDELPQTSTPNPSTTDLVEAISENAPSVTYDHDDTDMLRNFLTRVKANKEAKAKSIPKRKRSLPHSPIRLPLGDEVANSPSLESKDEFDVSLPGPSPSKRRKRAPTDEEDQTEPKSIRRSGRTRLPIKSPVAAPSFIPVRRLGQDQDSTVTLRRSEEKDLAVLTRVNTRKNKGGALHPAEVLAKKTEEKEDPAARQKALKEAFDEKQKKKGGKKKCVVWAEELTRFQGDEVNKPEPEKGEKVVDKVEEKKASAAMRVGVRSSRVSLGMAANGTPAPKRRKGRS